MLTEEIECSPAALLGLNLGVFDWLRGGFLASSSVRALGVLDREKRLVGAAAAGDVGVPSHSVW